MSTQAVLQRTRHRSWAGLARTAVGLLLLAILLAALDPQDVIASLGNAQLNWLALAVLAQIGAKLIWTARWQRILAIGGIRRGYWELMALVHVGLFFNSFLPTAVGGDLVRGYYVTGRNGVSLSYAALIVERALGLAALAAVGGAAATLILALDSPSFPASALTAVAVGGGTLLLLALLVPRLDLGTRLGPHLSAGRGRLARFAGPIVAGSKLLNAGASSPAILGWSFALQIVAVLFYVACARSVGIGIPLLDFFLIVPASVIASMLPVSLNGLGVREGVLVALTASRGAAGASAGGFAILALLVSTLFAVIGGILYAGGILKRIGGGRATDSA